MLKRRVKYDKIIFQKKSTEENSKNNILNKIPSGLSVLGGGISTYNNEVVKNQSVVGISVYAHPNASFFISPFPPTIFPKIHNNPTTIPYVIITANPNTTNCFVRMYGRNAAIFTNDAIPK